MSSLDDLIEQIQRLPQISPTLSRRIELCTQALKQVNQKTHSVLWAQLHVELGLCLHQMSSSNRVEHLEEAIGHFQAALTVYTRQKQPEAWAETMHNLASVYAERIRGERAENLEQAIQLYSQALEIHLRHALPKEWASTRYNLANVYVQRIKGNKADNLEKAIVLYQSTGEVWKQKKYPFDWARVQKGLGVAYTWRVQGNWPDNLQMAISCFNKALTVWSRHEHPLEWAEVQEGLGIAWRNYEEGNPAENVERAIACQQATLEVWARQTRPWEWARVQHNLGNAWRSRLKGNPTENLEQAIHCYRQALTVQTKEAYPEAWAETTHNMAIAYGAHFTAESLEESINFQEKVLEVYTRHTFPLAWARTQSELGNAYTRSIRGERATNFERAIKCYNLALEVQAQDVCPQEWARTQQNLAVAYGRRLIENRVNNLRKAIEHYKQALRVLNKRMPIRWATVQTSLADTYWKLGNLERLTRPDQAAEYLDQAADCCLEVVSVLDSLPPSSRWALAHYNLGNAYGDRIRGDRDENQKRAIEHYEMALKFYTLQVFPERWANSHNNLGVTYLERLHGNRIDNLAEATRHFNLALEVAKPEKFPVEARRAARNLGNLFFAEENWSEAHRAYNIAIHAAEMLYQASFMEVGRNVEISENATLYTHNAFCLARLGQFEQALTCLEATKTRTLNERLTRDAAQWQEARPKDQEAYRNLLNRLKVLEEAQRAGDNDYLSVVAGRSYTDIAKEVELVHQELNVLLQHIHTYLRDFLPDPLTFTAIRSLILSQGALVAPLITPQGSAVFVLLHGFQKIETAHLIWLDKLTEGNLNALLIGSESEPGWLRAYATWQNGGSFEGWEAAIETFTGQLWDILMGPIHDRLVALGLTEGAPVILMPQGGLGLLPLHAAWREIDGIKRAFFDDYTVTYAPSGYALNISQSRLQESKRQERSLLAMINPTGDLPFTPVEGEAVAALFDPMLRQTLVEDQATPQAVIQAVTNRAYLHFSCHGFYDWENVMRSGLFLAGGENGTPLTLAEIISNLDLSAARLVTLSACETGLTEFQQTPDEYIGLPAGFLQAGAPGVVSTLWAVNDLSTALLIERFYLYHLRGDPAHPDEGPLSPAQALRQGQKWLRDELTLAEVIAYIERQKSHAWDHNWGLFGSLETIQRSLLAQYSHHEIVRPFAHPYYWAAFTFIGA